MAYNKTVRLQLKAKEADTSARFMTGGWCPVILSDLRFTTHMFILAIGKTYTVNVA